VSEIKYVGVQNRSKKLSKNGRNARSAIQIQLKKEFYLQNMSLQAKQMLFKATVSPEMCAR
jgi:hypothetical protein